MLPFILIIIAYLLGNFSTSFIVGKLMGNIDIRNHGSGNAGSTNVFRTLGLKAGLTAFIGDSIKGVLAVYLARRFGGDTVALIAGVAAIVGHNWPFVLKFKGGKGIATSIGVALMVHPSSALICIAIGVVILLVFKYVSLASVSAIALLPIFLYSQGRDYFIFSVIISAMAIFRHRENIRRLFNGTERKITSKSKK